MQTDKSKDKPPVFTGELTQSTSIDHAAKSCPVPSVISMQTNQSKDKPPVFTGELTQSTSIDHAAKSSPVPSEISMQTDQSKGDPPVFTGELTQSTRMSTAGLGGVLCSVCPKMAFKSCLNCVASFCELHVRQHYTTPALQRHRLVEATRDLEQSLCQQHYRELEFFCQTDQTPVCAVCLIKHHRKHDIAENKSFHMMESFPEQKNLPAPKPIEFLSVKTDSVCLGWGAPEGPTEPLSFRVTWRSKADSGSLQVPEQMVDILNLTPGEEYTFTVTALYDGGSQSPHVSATVKTEIPAPEKVEVTAGPVLSVSWSKPAGVDEVSYLVTLSSAGKCLKTISTKNLHYAFSDLSVGTEYNTSVSAVQKNGAQSKPVSKTVRTGRTLTSTNRQSVKKALPIQELTRNCKTIKSGIPRCYLLLTKKSNIYQRLVRRWSFGKCEKSKPTKTILIVGEIGTGKTTLINTMVNYLLGVKLEDRVWFEISEEDKNRAESQTLTAITVYELFLETSPLNLRVIDTPGYVAGHKHNEQFAYYLHALFRSEDGIDEINAVGLVVKSTENCHTDFQLHVFDAIYALFGKDIDKHIMVFVTHSDGLSASNVTTALIKAKVPCAKDDNGTLLHFKFNNRQSENHEEGREELYKNYWNLGEESMDIFFRTLNDMESIEVKMIEMIPTKRFRLVTCINNLQNAIKMKELKESQLQQIQTSFEEAMFEVDEPYKDKVTIKVPWWHFNKGAMCCSICKENCHYPDCWLVKNLSNCEVVENNRCTVCSNRCHVCFHAKERFIYLLKAKKVTKTAKELKQQYKKKEDIEEELRKIKAKKSKGLEVAYQCIMELHEKVLKDYAFSDIDLDFFIEKMTEMGKDDKALILRNIKSGKRAGRRSKSSGAENRKGWRPWSGSEESQPLLDINDDGDEVVTHWQRGCSTPQQGSVSGEGQVRWRSSAHRHPTEKK